MTNVPIKFRAIDAIENETLHLSYVFDYLNQIETEIAVLPIKQETPIKALHIELNGKTSNPNISVSVEGETRLFTLNSAYITDRYPYFIDAVLDKAFVIEGYSTKNITKERVLIFLPMTVTSETTNVFYPLEQSIVNKTPIKGLTFDDYIPSIDIKNDYYIYYTFTDSEGCIYHMLYFTKTSLQYTSALKIPKNEDAYNSTIKANLYKCATVAKRHDNMNSQFEDNIYIDCVPVDIKNQQILKYMKYTDKIGGYYNDVLLYLVYVIMLTLVVYGIYYIYIYISKP